MRRIFSLLSVLLSGVLLGHSQPFILVSDFESLPLPGPDTFYVNYSQPGQDVGFVDGAAYFPTYYDTAWGLQFLSSGFVYSNHSDTLTGSFLNQYASREGLGALGSPQYAVCFGEENRLYLQDNYRGLSVRGFYISNSTFAWHIMKYGDPNFGVEPFGGADGQRPDWFKLTVYAYHQGQRSADSVEVYLADYRFSDTAQDTIYRGWKWVNLRPLGPVDSLEFRLSSSDIGPFGVNTPLYFCMDDLTIESSQSVATSDLGPKWRAYPNPFMDKVTIEAQPPADSRIRVYSMNGAVILDQPWQVSPFRVDMKPYCAGTYIFEIKGPGYRQTWSMIKTAR